MEYGARGGSVRADAVWCVGTVNHPSLGNSFVRHLIYFVGVFFFVVFDGQKENKNILYNLFWVGVENSDESKRGSYGSYGSYVQGGNDDEDLSVISPDDKGQNT